jgi:HPt (histidine-containing phosphotransfer) domain-containing protein
MTSTMENDIDPAAEPAKHHALLQEASSLLDRTLQQVRDDCDRLQRAAHEAHQRILSEAQAEADASGVAARRAAETDAAAIREAASHDAAQLRQQAAVEGDEILKRARGEAAVIVREARLAAERETASALAAVDRVRQQLGQFDDLRSRVEGSAQRLAAAEASGPAGEVSPQHHGNEPLGAEIDLSVLRTLESQVSAQDFVEVLDTFLSDIDNQLNRLEVARVAGETETAARVVHTLGSNCATVGAHGVAELCGSLSVDAPSEQFAELVARCRTVRQEVAAVRG